MKELDKEIARWALKRHRLSIDQVEEIRAEIGRTGRSFRDIAVGRGLLSAEDFKPPPLKLQPFYFALLACSVLIFGGLLAATLLKMGERTRKDDDLAIETERSRAEAERKGAEASRAYRRSVVMANEAAAREHLARARDAMTRIDTMLRTGALPNQVGMVLNEAFVEYNMYLKEIPDDADVRIERARTHELRRNYDLAIADLERAAQLRPDLKPNLKDRIAQLRLFLPQKPQ